MRNVKEYKAPAALITEFECADVITVSGELGTSIKGNQPATGGTDYVNIGGRSWSDIKGGN